MGTVTLRSEVLRDVDGALDLRRSGLGDLLNCIQPGNVTFSTATAQVTIECLPVLGFSLELMFATQKAVFFGGVATVSTTGNPHILQVSRVGAMLEVMLPGATIEDEVGEFCAECGRFVRERFDDAVSAMPELLWNPHVLAHPMLVTLYTQSAHQRR